MLLDPALLFEGGGLQIDPDRLKFGEFLQRLDLFLK
jgi:hypothetical protein